MEDKKWEQLSPSEQAKYQDHIKYLFDKGYIRDQKISKIDILAKRMYEVTHKKSLEPTNGMNYRNPEDTKEIK